MKKYSDSHDMESMSISVYSETEDSHLQTLLAKNKEKNKNQVLTSSNKKEIKKSMLINEAKMMPSWFFILSVLILAVMLFKYLPSYHHQSRFKSFISKFTFRSFSEYYYELDITLKVTVYFYHRFY
jgi:hypothetical protein